MIKRSITSAKHFADIYIYNYECSKVVNCETNPPTNNEITETEMKEMVTG